MKSAGTERLRLADGRWIDVAVRTSRRARRILISVAPVGGAVELVLPRGATRSEGLAFLARKADWIAEKTATALDRIPFENGAVIPFLGGHLTLRCAGGSDPGVERDGDVLRVRGLPENVSKQTAGWLRCAAQEEIAPRVREKSARLGSTFGRIGLRDTVSRWGSCSSAGNLSFSWRLAMAPLPVLDYVVAHEVAHLVEANHGSRFWSLVGELCDDPDASRAWLRRHGPGLHRYG